MKFAIEHSNDVRGMVWVRFEDHVPVEVREAMMAANFSYDWVFHGWASLDRPDEEICRIINDAEKTVKARPVMTKAEEKELEEEWLRREMSLWHHGDRWLKYFKGRVGALVVLEDGRIVNIEKPSIETSFCYGESGYDMDDAVAAAERARTSENHFRWANLRRLKEAIDILERRPLDGYCARTCVTTNSDSSVCGTASISFSAHWDTWHNKPTKELSEEDRERVLEGYRKVYASFEKRIDVYLKRYGLSKVRAWTYWRDA